MSDQIKACIYEWCERPKSDRLTAPLCAHHARKVYLEVKDMVETAEWWERAGLAHPSDLGPPSPHQPKPGVIYFARFGEVIKIGYSTNVKQRMRNLGADELLATVPGTMQDERALHAKFGRSWERGEYFRPTKDLMAYIERLGKP